MNSTRRRLGFVGLLALTCMASTGLATMEPVPARAMAMGIPVKPQHFETGDLSSSAAVMSATSYSARTAEEIAEIKKKRQEKKEQEARERAAQGMPAVAAVSSASAPNSNGLLWPASGSLNDGFGDRGGAHMGVDIGAAQGTPIYAAGDGTVIVSSESYGGYGVGIVIDHGDGKQTVYGHMVYGSRLVEAGQQVTAGQQIGSVGNTGRSFGAHLHFEVHVNGVPMDPLNFVRP